jgi:hypothetical protein
MGSRLEVAIALSFASVSRSACASGRTAAIFDGEFAETRVKAATNGPRPGEAGNHDWRERLASCGQFDGADIVPAAPRRSANNLRRRGDRRLAAQPPVMLLVAGSMRTASHPIPNRDASSAAPIKAEQPGKKLARRGDTDQCWLFANASLSNHLSAQQGVLR